MATEQLKSAPKNIQDGDLKKVTLITPYDLESNSDFSKAIRVPFFSGRGVCLPPEEYKRMIKVDLSYEPIKEACIESPKFRDEIQGYSLVIGLITGSLIGGLTTLILTK